MPESLIHIRNINETFYWPDVSPITKPIVSKHQRQNMWLYILHWKI